jgi:hypothetical protein
MTVKVSHVKEIFLRHSKIWRLSIHFVGEQLAVFRVDFEMTEKSVSNLSLALATKLKN